MLPTMIASAEEVTWNRFYNFSMANSILILAWATFYASGINEHDLVITAAICVLGVCSSVLWAGLGLRGRQYVDLYVVIGRQIESRTIDTECSKNGPERGPWPAVDGTVHSRLFHNITTTRDEHGPLFPKLSSWVSDRRPGWFSGSRFILVAAPLGFAVLYFVIFGATIWAAAVNEKVSWLLAGIGLFVLLISLVGLSSMLETPARFAAPATQPDLRLQAVEARLERIEVSLRAGQQR